MGSELFTAIIVVIIACVFIYLIIWTIGFFRTGLNKKRAKQEQESLEKIENIRLRTIGCAKNYWYNKQDVEDCTNKKLKETLYHYFDDIDDCITDLIVEMYDCALVRTEELSRIAYGESVFENVDEEAAKVDTPDEDETDDAEDVNDTDIKKALEDDENASMYNEELDGETYVGLSEDEKRRRVAIKASIYEHWVSYVFQLYQLIDINANEDLKNRIQKELMHYGYNDIKVLLHSPEENFE